MDGGRSGRRRQTIEPAARRLVLENDRRGRRVDHHVRTRLDPVVARFGLGRVGIGIARPIVAGEHALPMVRGRQDNRQLSL